MKKYTRLHYTNPYTGDKEHIAIAPEMFDPESRTRQDLKNVGVDFLSDEEIIKWVANKDIPGSTPYELEFYNPS